MGRVARIHSRAARSKRAAAPSNSYVFHFQALGCPEWRPIEQGTRCARSAGCFPATLSCLAPVPAIANHRGHLGLHDAMDGQGGSKKMATNTRVNLARERKGSAHHSAWAGAPTTRRKRGVVHAPGPSRSQARRDFVADGRHPEQCDARKHLVPVHVAV